MAEEQRIPLLDISSPDGWSPSAHLAGVPPGRPDSRILVRLPAGGLAWILRDPVLAVSALKDMNHLSRMVAAKDSLTLNVARKCIGGDGTEHLRTDGDALRRLHAASAIAVNLEDDHPLNKAMHDIAYFQAGRVKAALDSTGYANLVPIINEYVAYTSILCGAVGSVDRWSGMNLNERVSDIISNGAPLDAMKDWERLRELTSIALGINYGPQEEPIAAYMEIFDLTRIIVIQKRHEWESDERKGIDHDLMSRLVHDLDINLGPLAGDRIIHAVANVGTGWKTPETSLSGAFLLMLLDKNRNVVLECLNDHSKFPMLTNRAVMLRGHFGFSGAMVVKEGHETRLMDGAGNLVTFKAGEVLIASMYAMLGYEGFVDRPGELILSQKGQHLPYGQGPHICLFMSFAKKQMNYLTEAIITTNPGIGLAEDPKQIPIDMESPPYIPKRLRVTGRWLAKCAALR